MIVYLQYIIIVLQDFLCISSSLPEVVPPGLGEMLFSGDQALLAGLAREPSVLGVQPLH